MSRDDVLSTWNGDDVLRRAKTLAGKSAWTIGMAVLSDAKQLCPVDLGYLAASLMAASADREQGFGETPPGVSMEGGPRPDRYQRIRGPGFFGRTADVFVGTAVEYGPYVEYGTFRMDAQPFLRPALDMAFGKALTIVKADAKIEFGDYLNPKGIMTHDEARAKG